ncbi:SagB family peptide dehydrogenase [Embleya scabrispora]|uniref:SagB family peptide dehydrogenase n=1 Tax=Embleya scabrispora TaxID=159449 RepID=UPI00037CE87E|nr:SagB family peptide dehydrogenase [Embleya scabrispora]MYS83521.1 SagB/ThcOx family dehydrogenase [Streptomyces sp. SID5474]
MTSLGTPPAAAVAAPTESTPVERIALHPGARVNTAANGATLLFLGPRGLALGVLSPGVAAAVALLAAHPCAEDDLHRAVLAHDGETTLLELPALLGRLRRGGWLGTHLEVAGRPLLTLRPLAPPGPLPGTRGAAVDRARLRLSRFALLRRDGEHAVLESPLAPVAAELTDPALAALLAGLPHRPVDPPPGVERALDLLARHGLLVDPEAEDADPDRAQWSPHELWFHGRTRAGRHDLPYGGTYWRAASTAPLPAVRPPFAGPTIDLPRPDLDLVRRADPSLTEVLEGRRSIRVHDDAAPLTLDRLGEFLYRSARNRAIFHEERQEIGDRPYPSGGRCHELELYPLINNVEGVAPGLYHYDPQGHRLERVAEPGPAVHRLSEVARATSLMATPPQVVLVVSARFGRVMWKYQTMGYALVLKHVGVLYQTMYLVAGAMGLAACGLGGGDSDMFALATGNRWEHEGSVGEFLLGTIGPRPDRVEPDHPERAGPTGGRDALSS